MNYRDDLFPAIKLMISVGFETEIVDRWKIGLFKCGGMTRPSKGEASAVNQFTPVDLSVPLLMTFTQKSSHAWLKFYKLIQKKKKHPVTLTTTFSLKKL